MDNNNQDEDQRAPNGSDILAVAFAGFVIARLVSAFWQGGENANNANPTPTPVLAITRSREFQEGYHQESFQSVNSPNAKRIHEMMGNVTLCLTLYLLLWPKQPIASDLDNARQQLFNRIKQSKADHIGKQAAQDTDLQDILHGCVGQDTLRRIRDVCEGNGRVDSLPRRALPGDPSGQKNKDAMVGDRVLDLTLYIYGQKKGLDHSQLDMARQKLFSNSNLGGRSQATEIEAHVGSLAVSNRTRMLKSLQKCIDETTLDVLHEIVNRY